MTGPTIYTPLLKVCPAGDELRNLDFTISIKDIQFNVDIFPWLANFVGDYIYSAKDLFE
jgi:hypothetical protein